ncbi:hypothetical protein B0T20DRAFT_58617 [Sordaria brevicollis]|uniref:Uncharacterized protein n=1 Tax=Sordaria brevicollis TaxID=83679 RepID=A0AAE0P3A0_SORBR|nr:hypothetical protein B0T20DRAFT_58617 [Sordaria brevicollis]
MASKLLSTLGNRYAPSPCTTHAFLVSFIVVSLESTSHSLQAHVIHGTCEAELGFGYRPFTGPSSSSWLHGLRPWPFAGAYDIAKPWSSPRIAQMVCLARRTQGYPEVPFAKKKNQQQRPDKSDTAHSAKAWELAVSSSFPLASGDRHLPACTDKGLRRGCAQTRRTIT